MAVSLADAIRPRDGPVVPVVPVVPSASELVEMRRIGATPPGGDSGDVDREVRGIDDGREVVERGARPTGRRPPGQERPAEGIARADRIDDVDPWDGDLPLLAAGGPDGDRLAAAGAQDDAGTSRQEVVARPVRIAIRCEEREVIVARLDDVGPTGDRGDPSAIRRHVGDGRGPTIRVEHDEDVGRDRRDEALDRPARRLGDQRQRPDMERDEPGCDGAGGIVGGQGR
jgi:hypothetical protein